MRREVKLYRKYKAYYGYVFYICKKVYPLLMNRINAWLRSVIFENVSFLLYKQTITSYLCRLFKYLIECSHSNSYNRQSYYAATGYRKTIRLVWCLNKCSSLKGEYGLLGFIQLTLSPTNVSFKKIKIIERDGGLMWEGKNSKPPKTKPELANEHKTCNLAGSVGNKNHFYDMVGDNRLIEEIIGTIKNSKYNPQKFWLVCKLYVHRGHGGEGSEAEDTILLSTTNQKYHIEAIDESTTNTIVEKFNIKFERNSNDG